ncbi:hypothetical protein ACHAQJ_006564 [Trichoderma viride]
MARGQGEPPEAHQAPALKGQSAGVLMDCQGHEQGYMQGFCRGLQVSSGINHRVAPAHTGGPCSRAVRRSTSNWMSLCSVAPPEATGATVKLRLKLARADDSKCTGAAPWKKAALTAMSISQSVLS